MKPANAAAAVVTVPTAAAAAPAEAGYSRLHITPFDSQLLKVIVPAAILPQARRISYHILQTQPDRPYGFVDLPTADAEKIKKKLNGAVLKGAKIRIEPARPEYIPQPIPDAIMTESTKPKRPKGEKKDKKRKRDAQELVGVELEEGRKVKRGWTVTSEEAVVKKRKEKDEERKSKKSKDKKDRDKDKDKADKKEKKKKRKDPESKYSELPECLVKTHLPPNKVDLASGEKKKSKKGSKQDVLVHEFEKNTKFASFLKTAAPSSSTPSGKEGAIFVEGKGWVDKEGNVLEKVKSTKPTTFPKLQISNGGSSSRNSAAKEDDTTSSSGSSSGEESEEEEEKEEEEVAGLGNQTQGSPEQAKLTSPVRPPTSLAAALEESPRPRSAGSMRSLTIKIPPATPTPAAVHPLEALYKRQQQQDIALPPSTAKPSTEAEPFTFFSGADIEDEEDEDIEPAEDERPGSSSQGNTQLPMTPFTKQDYEWRNTRSAAPTPDTAHPSRISRLWAPRGEDEDLILDEVEEEEEEEDGLDDAVGVQNPAADEGEGGTTATTTNPHADFQKWFWEHRGDLNRSWKKRRKLSAKEKRYRDNKARAEKAI